MKNNYIFLSYCRDNQAEVARLRDDLINAGEVVWWDQEIKGGQDWKSEIRRAMKQSYAVILCLSAELQDRSQSGVYPEVYDAITAYRLQNPFSVFLIPVRLSNCEAPDIEIDDTRTLNRLQIVDLFPDANRAEGLKRLLQALQTAKDNARKKS